MELIFNLQTDMKMRCIIIDDEQLAIDLIRSYVEENPFLELAGTFLDLKRAVRFVMEGNVDLIFTDIELNVGMNGLDFVRSIPDAPMVIFISAYDRYAVDSYTVDAVDYLVKPVSRERFFKAVNKAYGIYVQKKGISPSSAHFPAGQEPSKMPEFMFVKVENRLVKIQLKDILYIKGYGDYIRIYLDSGEMLLSLQTLSRIESMLPDSFMRIHRSYIVAIDKISEIEHKRIRIGNEVIPIGDNYHESFFRKLNIEK